MLDMLVQLSSCPVQSYTCNQHTLWGGCATTIAIKKTCQTFFNNIMDGHTSRYFYIKLLWSVTCYACNDLFFWNLRHTFSMFSCFPWEIKCYRHLSFGNLYRSIKLADEGQMRWAIRLSCLGFIGRFSGIQGKLDEVTGPEHWLESNSYSLWMLVFCFFLRPKRWDQKHFY